MRVITLDQVWANDGDTSEVWRENQAGEENKKTAGKNLENMKPNLNDRTMTAPEHLACSSNQ